LPYDALGDFYLAGLMNFNLGGTFDSRLNLKLREEKGWTYGAYSGFAGGQEMGSFEFSAEFKGEATVDAITAALAELEAYANSGPTQEEFQYMQNAVSQNEALRYETPGAKLGLLDQILTYDLPLDYRDEQKALLQATDRATLSRLAASLLQPENLAIIVVGDAATLKSQLQQLPWPLTELDAEGFVVPETK
jgi:zinc protease